MEWSDQLHVPTVLPQGKERQCQLNMMPGGPQNQSEPFEVQKEVCPFRDSNTGSPSLLPSHYTDDTTENVQRWVTGELSDVLPFCGCSTIGLVLPAD
jgi:hypothetical protein